MQKGDCLTFLLITYKTCQNLILVYVFYIFILRFMISFMELLKAQEEEQHNPLSTWYSVGYLFLWHFLSHILSQKFQLKAKKIHPPY